jgi:hypothetical protein
MRSDASGQSRQACTFLKGTTMFSLRTALLPLVAGAALLAGVAGCHHDHHDDMSTMDTSNMSKSEMMHKGDKMIAKGEDMKQKAMKMDDNATMHDMTKQQMMDKGDMMVRQGQDMKDKANSM